MFTSAFMFVLGLSSPMMLLAALQSGHTNFIGFLLSKNWFLSSLNSGNAV